VFRADAELALVKDWMGLPGRAVVMADQCSIVFDAENAVVGSADERAEMLDLQRSGSRIAPQALLLLGAGRRGGNHQRQNQWYRHVLHGQGAHGS
jgi:hypothetical protein